MSLQKTVYCSRCRCVSDRGLVQLCRACSGFEPCGVCGKLLDAGRTCAACKKFIPAKVGTQPLMIRVDGRTTVKLNARIRFKESPSDRRWQTGIVNHVEPLRIERM